MSSTDDRCWINGGGFALDGKTHMTGAQIRSLPMPSIRDTDDLYMEVPGGQDLVVHYDEVVPVAGRRFFSVPSIINAGAPSVASGHEIGAVAELKRYTADDVGTQSYLTKAEASALLSLLIEADSFISHMVYRGSWPDAGTNDVERLIGRLRRAS